jgi:glycosyltransferase involved in cell wall biosynthesis
MSNIRRISRGGAVMSGANRRFKILIYGEYFLPVVGGVQTSMNLLARGLVELNSRPERDANESEIDVTVVIGTAADGMDDSVFPYRVVRRPGFWRLAKLIRDADVIHVAGPCLLPMAIGWLIGKPVVVEHHGYQAICPNGLLFREPSRAVCPGYFGRKRYGKCVHCASETMGLLGGIRALVLTFPRRWLCKRVPANITISDHVATRLKLPRARTVYYGIEESPNVRAGVASPPRGAFHMAYVGRLVIEKGPALLLEAAKYLAGDGIRFQLSFIGDGPERARLEKLADDLRLRDSTVFAGDLRGSQLEEAVAEVDLVVMPSLCEETAGLSAIEQMMRGRVVIVADIGGMSEVVGDAGLKFAPGDSQALAACIRKVIDNPALTVSLGLMAQERAMRFFKLGSMIEGHVSLYREVWLGKMQKRGPDGIERHTEV